MAVFNNILAGAAGSGGAAAYEIERSLRFNKDDGAYLNRTPSSAGNRRTFTLSFWIKRAAFTANTGRAIFYAGTAGQTQNRTGLLIGNAAFSGSGNSLVFGQDTGGAWATMRETTALFRDHSAWAHIVLAVDTTQINGTDRIKIYVNGVLQTNFATTNDPAQNFTFLVNNNVDHYIGKDVGGYVGNLDAYLADFHLIDGQALAATDFGEFDVDTGVWDPIRFSGNHGTNGFHLDFSDNSSDSALGTDAAGSNNWNVNNLRAVATGTNYADYVYAGDSTYDSTETGTNYFTGAGSNENLFDGNLNSQVGGTNASNSWVYFRPATAITGVTSLRLYGAYNSTTKVNGTDYAESPSWSSTAGWVSVPNPPSSITEIALQGSGGAASRISAIEVNGTILVDVPNSDIDSLLDSPTNYDDGTNVGGNYAVLNPLDKHSDFTTSNGNLDVSTSGTNWRSIRATIGITSGKYYWEFTTGHQRATVGIALSSSSVLDDYIGNNSNGWSYLYDGNKYHNAAIVSYGDSYTAGDTIGVAFDADAGEIYFYKNGTIQNSGTAAYTGLTSGPYFPAFSFRDSSSTFTANFGQRPFSISSIPTGFKPLCTQSFDDPLIADGSTAMDVALYTGNGTSQSITGLGFSPDFVWVKERSGVDSHCLSDTVRGDYWMLRSDLTNADSQYGNVGIHSLTSGGFSVGSGSAVNSNNETYVAWAWDAGSSTVSNTDGTITSQVRANPSAGFSIVSWTASTQSTATIGHGLGKQPELIIAKTRDGSGNWYVFHPTLDTGGTISKALYLNSDVGKQTVSGVWGHWDEMTSTTFGITDAAGSGTNDGDMIAYCFTSVDQFSSFGNFIGNGDANGPFVYTGFRPRFLLLKNADISSGGWVMFDTERDTYNVMDARLFANTSDQEGNSSSNPNIVDALSNGFKVRYSGQNFNGSGNSIIYAAFAENPFKYARAV